LFCWATGFAASKRSDLRLRLIYRKTKPSNLGVSARKLEIDYFPEIRGHICSAAPPSKILQKVGLLPTGPVIKENPESFDSRVFQVTRGTTLDGYFQDPRYFQQYTEEIRELLWSGHSASQASRDLEMSFGANWVAVHVRRGDYMNFTNIYEIPDGGYYSKALSILNEEERTGTVVVFSDDIDEAKAVVPGAGYYIGPKDLHSPGDNLMLMAKAPSIVGANSSFSWWAAFLSLDPKSRVIFPQRWTRAETKNGAKMMPGWIGVDSKIP